MHRNRGTGEGPHDGCSSRSGGQMAASIFVDPCIALNHRKVSLMRGKPKPPTPLVVAGRAPCGVMLLGTTQSITAKIEKVKYFSTCDVAGVMLDGSWTRPEEIM